MAINPYYRRKVRVQNLGFKSLEGVLQNEGTVRINLTDGAAFLYDSGQNFSDVALPSGATGKGARRYKAYIYEGVDVICGFCDVEGAGEAVGADLAVNGAMAADTNWDKGAGWTIGAGIATAVAGEASDLAASANIAGTRGQLYKMTLDTALTAGALTIKAGSLVLGTVTTANDGTGLTFYFTNDGTNFKPTFSKDAAMAGSIDNVVVKAVTAAAADVSIKLFAAQVAGSQNIEGALASVPTNFNCAGTITYKIVPLF